MLRVGLTGGIGAGKSTVARLLAGHGAVLVDADVIAREVVARGTPGLAAVVEEFGPDVLTAAGDLDRPALGRRVFGDERQRAALNAIVHPLVAARRAELAAAAPAGSVVVEDVPLLVETGAAPGYPLVVVVDADAAERVRRLVTERGMSEDDALARLRAQATDDERRAAADVLLANPRRAEDRPDPLPGLVSALWSGRLLPFEAAVRAGRPAPARPGVPPADAVERARRRVAHATAGPVEVVDASAWPVRLRASAEGALTTVGYVDAGQGRFASADPGAPVAVELVREARVGGPA
ncbi:dephospho-CoA kinase [Kineococcus rhizosphaerae]|uniref:Dephospho-CoA kinase n=1 Tax=Kineococcus rhizosphaerae TaxID=559628 RepID=A0A2T0RA28_9ACTN|nr:dephospho-CoA kinase [Kineococcus rhizosphaerae]PRY17990.1 dephospho-CoA kinase [Kineococcus rhizosphaerae]